ncbi:MAG: hypothetical protein WC475_02480, partial [Candidatus Paceibacterota bacterium]
TIFISLNNPTKKALEKSDRIYGEIQKKYRANRAILQKSPTMLHYIEKNIRKIPESIFQIPDMLADYENKIRRPF